MKAHIFSMIAAAETADFLPFLNEIHQAETSVNTSVYFVPIELQKRAEGIQIFHDKDLFRAVSFPESQLFMTEEYESDIYLINDAHGIRKFGNAAYFVPSLMYRKVIEAFEKSFLNP